jgi:aerobic carbon-monoxide dehydrogenase medium subunit
MRHFELSEPKTIREACALLGDHPDAKAVAGGTALLTVIKQGLLRPNLLVNLKKIRDASEIGYDPQHGLRVGALTTISEMESSSLVQQHYPILAEACHTVANIRIRNMATIGGNLAHGDYQSDPPTVLAALDARIELMNERGVREMKLSDFQRGSYETALEAGELLAAVVIPPLPPAMRGQYVKFTTGSSEERPCAGIAVLAVMEDEICRELRVAVGAVAAKPCRIEAEEFARDMPLTTQLIATIADHAGSSIDAIDDVRGPADYKRKLVTVLVRRAIMAVANEPMERRI